MTAGERRSCIDYLAVSTFHGPFACLRKNDKSALSSAEGLLLSSGLVCVA